MARPVDAGRHAHANARKLARNQKRKYDHDRFARTTLEGGRVLWGAPSKRPKGNGKKLDKAARMEEESRLRKVRVDQLAKEIATAKRKIHDHNLAVPHQPTVDGVDYESFEFGHYDADYDEGEHSFGRHLQGGLVNTVKRETQNLLAKRAKRKRYKQYAKEQMDNIEIQRRIIPALGRTWADNAMYDCFCMEQDMSTVKIYFMDILCKFRIL